MTLNCALKPAPNTQSSTEKPHHPQPHFSHKTTSVDKKPIIGKYLSSHSLQSLCSNSHCLKLAKIQQPVQRFLFKHSQNPKSLRMAYSLRSLVVFFLFFFSSVSLSFSSEAEKVSLVLYYETLCPYCSRFIVNGLTKVFEKDLYKIVDLKLVPYGNAKVDGVGNIACQHGEYECLLNTVEACAISAWPDLNEHFPFIYCVESLVMDGKQKEWQSCFGKLSYDSKPIEQCYKSGLGQKLDLQYANETINLEPPHTYVPWVVVNGQPLYDDYWSFIDVVCKAYEGTDLPKACTEPSLKIIPTTEENGNPQVTYIEGKSQASTTIEPAKLRTKASSYRRQMMSVSA